MGKKGGSSTTVQSYQPTAQEIRLQKAAADYSEAIAPNALWLNTVARGVLQDSLGTIQVDYNNLAKQATAQSTAAQNGVANLTQGVLPSAFQTNMENSLKSGVNNTVGNTISSLGARGVLGSSVTNTALNNISQNVSDTMAQQYQNNLSALNGLYGQQASLAGNNITLNAAAQEAAQTPALNLWNASLGLNSGGTLGALSAMSGSGTTTSTTNGGGNSWLGGLFNGAVSLGSAALSCFVEETPIKMADGEQKAIRKVKTGDKVVAYDNTSDKDTVEEVTEVMEPHYSDVYIVICQDGSGSMRNIGTTLTQPLMLSDGTFKDVAMLRIGEQLKNVGTVRGIAYSGERKVYDFKTTNSKRNSTYYANGFVAKAATDEWGETA